MPVAEAGVDCWYKYPADAKSRCSTPVSAKFDFGGGNIARMVFSCSMRCSCLCAETRKLRTKGCCRRLLSAVVPKEFLQVLFMPPSSASREPRTTDIITNSCLPMVDHMTGLENIVMSPHRAGSVGVGLSWRDAVQEVACHCDRCIA